MKQSNCICERLNVHLHPLIYCCSSGDLNLTQSFLCLLSCEKNQFSTISWLLLSMGDNINNNHKSDSAILKNDFFTEYSQ